MDLPAGPESPTKGDNLVEPLFEEGRDVVPIHGVLKDNPVELLSEALLSGNIDASVGVHFVEVANDNGCPFGQGFEQRSVGF